MDPVARIGDFRVYRVEEMLSPGFEPGFLFPDYDPEIYRQFPELQRTDPLDPATGRLIASIHSWVLRRGDEMIVVDTCSGNDKPRPHPAFQRFHMLDLPWLDRFAAVAGSPYDVGLVVNTHLHVDHVGWNTRLDDGRWVPTFANARYLMGRAEFANWTSDGRSLLAHPQGAPVIEDSVLPVVEAKRVDFVDAGDEIAPGVSFLAAPGHTMGQLALRVESRGEVGLFTADVMHRPSQVHRPALNSCFCEDNAVAPMTRRDLLDMVADIGALIFPAHFGPPHAGHVRRRGDAFAFEPVQQTK